MIGVTVLTSMNQQALRETGIVIDLMDHVLRLAELAKEAGLDGVVASARETPLIRTRFGHDFTIVTPGIRPAARARSKTIRSERWDPRRPFTRAPAIWSSAGRLSALPDPASAARASRQLSLNSDLDRAGLDYFAVIMKCPRRFCCQQLSFSSLQNGCSLPLLTIWTRSAATPRLTR